jgi:hypothetical protein
MTRPILHGVIAGERRRKLLERKAMKLQLRAERRAERKAKKQVNVQPRQQTEVVPPA